MRAPVNLAPELNTVKYHYTDYTFNLFIWEHLPFPF